MDIFFVPLAPSVYPILPYLREIQDEYQKQYETLKNLRFQEKKLGYDIITGFEKENIFATMCDYIALHFEMCNSLFLSTQNFCLDVYFQKLKVNRYLKNNWYAYIGFAILLD